MVLDNPRRVDISTFFYIFAAQNNRAMNSPINKQIVDFINDFNLLNDEPLMHFNGRILYLEKNIPHFYDCEIAIVTIKAKQLDAIYLLNSEIREDGFEEMFVIKNESIKYVKDQYLLIERNNKLQVYIFPGKSHSSPEQKMKEIKTDG